MNINRLKHISSVQEYRKHISSILKHISSILIFICCSFAEAFSGGAHLTLHHSWLESPNSAFEQAPIESKTFHASNGGLNKCDASFRSVIDTFQYSSLVSCHMCCCPVLVTMASLKECKLWVVQACNWQHTGHDLDHSGQLWKTKYEKHVTTNVKST